MARLSTLLLRNASANVVRGLATAAVALALPHFLTRALDPGRFAAWSLILQISSYASFLDFGLQTAVARFLAQAIETGEDTRRDALVSTAVALLSCAALVAFGVIALLLWKSSVLFPGVPSSLGGEFRGSALLLAGSACLLLPLSTSTAVLLALHRNEFPALAIGCSRVCGAGAVILLARHTHSLVVLSVALGGFNLLGALAQAGIVRHLLPSLRPGLRKIHRAIALDLARTCAGLSVWSFGMLLVSGLDVTLVGHFRFAAVGAYSVAATLALFFAGLNQSVVSALMTPLAALHARGRNTEIASLTLRITRLTSVANFALASFCLLAGRPLLNLWVGPEYSSAAYPLLCVLVCGQAIRLTLNPYAVALVAVGEQNRTLMPALVESLLNLAVSVAGVLAFGPIGVAVGTLAGACAGSAAVLRITVPRVRHDLPLRAPALLRHGLLQPLLCCTPLLLAWAAGMVFPAVALPGALLGCAATAGLAALTQAKPNPARVGADDGAGAPSFAAAKGGM